LKPTSNTGAYRPTPVSSGAARWPAWRWQPVPGGAQHGDTVWPGKAYQRFKDAAT
jgi:aminopeptidase N